MRKTTEKALTNEQKKKIRELVEVYYDYQDCRIGTSNRLAMKKDGEEQNKEFPQVPLQEIPEIVDILDNARDLENNISKLIKNELKGIPVYEKFLKKVKGCGPITSAVLLSYIDIEKATNASKIVQYAGLNSGMVFGKKKNEKGEIVVTTDLVRGDKHTKGYILPYNKKLKAKMLGVLADCFVKSKSQYKVYYDNYKNRLSNSEAFVNGTDRKWKDEPKAHIERASRRYMVKIFLQDLYGVWRSLEGLEVREPYQKEYLGHTTTMPSIAKMIMEEE